MIHLFVHSFKSHRVPLSSATDGREHNQSIRSIQDQLQIKLGHKFPKQLHRRDGEDCGHRPAPSPADIAAPRVAESERIKACSNMENVGGGY